MKHPMICSAAIMIPGVVYDLNCVEVPGMREQMAEIEAELKETLALVREATRTPRSGDPLGEMEIRAARARLSQREIEA